LHIFQNVKSLGICLFYLFGAYLLDMIVFAIVLCVGEEGDLAGMSAGTQVYV